MNPFTTQGILDDHLYGYPRRAARTAGRRDGTDERRGGNVARVLREIGDAVTTPGGVSPQTRRL